MSNKNRFLFVKILNSLLESDIALSKALCIIQKMKSAKKAVRKAAEEIELYLQQGSLLSVALQKCSAIEFNSIYGAFVSCAQSGGSIKKVFTFLYLREYGLRQKKQKLIYSIIYPVFVTLVAMTGCILLMTFGKNIIPNISGKFDFDLYKQNAVKGCISANLFLVACIIAFCLAIKNLFSMEEYVDSFKILNFLTASGVDFYNALKTSLLAAKENKKLKKQIILALCDLEHGHKASKACQRFGEEFLLQIELAEQSGQADKALNSICESLEKKNEEWSKVFMQMTEPLSMTALAIYITLLLKTVVMPALFEYGI